MIDDHDGLGSTVDPKDLEVTDELIAKIKSAPHTCCRCKAACFDTFVEQKRIHRDLAVCQDCAHRSSKKLSEFIKNKGRTG